MSAHGKAMNLRGRLTLRAGLCAGFSLLFISVGLLWSQSEPASTEKSSIDTRLTNYTYKDTAFSSIRAVNFKNLSVFDCCDEHGNFDALGTLKNGRLSEKNKDGIRELWLDSVRYFDFKNGKPQKALALFFEFSAGGSSSEGGTFEVFEINTEHHLYIKQQIEFDSRGAGKSIFNSETGILTVRSIREDSGPHCCPTEKEIAKFQWNGSVFRLSKSHIVKISTQAK